jgi:hypothetical protein
MDQTTIIAIVGSSANLTLSMLGIFLWVRSEAKNARRSIKQSQTDHKKDLLEISYQIQRTVDAIQIEMKDFHNRLCMIESQRKDR